MEEEEHEVYGGEIPDVGVGWIDWFGVGNNRSWMRWRGEEDITPWEMSLSSSILQRNCESSASDLDMAENRGGGGWCPPMDLMRSEPMQLVQVIVPKESAHLTVFLHWWSPQIPTLSTSPPLPPALQSPTFEPPPPRCFVFPFLKSVNMPKLRVTSEFDSDSLFFFNKVSCKIFDNLAKLKLSFHNNTQRQVSQPQVSFTPKYVSVLYDVEEKNAFVKSTVDVSPRLQLRALHNVKVRLLMRRKNNTSLWG